MKKDCVGGIRAWPDRSVSNGVPILNRWFQFVLFWFVSPWLANTGFSELKLPGALIVAESLELLGVIINSSTLKSQS